MDWNALQECFRQQYSKFGSSREQYFHVWRSFHYDENTDTIDSYILKVKQVASLLNYGEPEILELFKNTLPNKLYWILFPVNNLREAVDTAKRVLNKEKLDKQLTGQASNISPFMNMRDDTQSGQKMLMKPQYLEGMTSMMYNMSLQQGKTKKPFKPQVYQKRGRGQRQNYDRNRPRNNNGKEKTVGKIGIEMIIEGMGICKISIEMVEILTGAIGEIGVDQEIEVYPQGGIIVITGKMETLDLDQGLGVTCNLTACRKFTLICECIWYLHVYMC